MYEWAPRLERRRQCHAHQGVDAGRRGPDPGHPRQDERRCAVRDVDCPAPCRPESVGPPRVLPDAGAAAATIIDSDASLSKRWLDDGRPERDVLSWPVWLVQVQLWIAYVFTVVAKLNPAFLGGEVLQRSMEFPAAWVWLTPWLALLTLAAELFVGVGLWMPAVRPWALVVGFGLHGLVPLLMGPYVGLVVFTLLVWSVYILFLDAAPQSRLVVWDDTCGFCRGWVHWLRRLDWLHIHRFEGSSRAEVLAEAGVSAEEASEEIKVRVGARTSAALPPSWRSSSCCRWDSCGRARSRCRLSAGSAPRRTGVSRDSGIACCRHGIERYA